MKTTCPTTSRHCAADTTANANAAASAAGEINRLHAEAQRLAAESRHSLDGALAAAWHAGHLLIAEKKRVRHVAGHGAWLPWLEHFFEGSDRTAQRYMKLANTVSDPALLHGLSLRQAYARLGIATEPKRPLGIGIGIGIGIEIGNKIPLPKPPEHVLLASKLVRILRQQRHEQVLLQKTPAWLRDLAVLYEQLRSLFDVKL